MPARPPPMVTVVLALWLALPLLHAGTTAQDAVPFVVAGDLLGDEPDAIYVDSGRDLYDLETSFRERSCLFYSNRADCDAEAVAYIASPAALPLVAPLGAVSGDVAVLVLRVVGVVAIAAGFLLLLDRVGPVDERLAVGAALLLTFEVNHQVTLGQTSPLLFLAAALSLERTRSRRAAWGLGILVAVCVALKLFPAVLLIPVVLARRWSVLAAAAVALTGLCVLSVAFGGADLWAAFVDSTRSVADASSDNPYNAALSAVLDEPVGAALGFVLLAGLVFVLRKATIDERWSLAIPLALLVVPQVWGHYLPTLLAAIGVVVSRRTARPFRWWLVAVVALTPYAVAAGLDQDLTSYQAAFLVAGLVACSASLHRAPLVRADVR